MPIENKHGNTFVLRTCEQKKICYDEKIVFRFLSLYRNMLAKCQYRRKEKFNCSMFGSPQIIFISHKNTETTFSACKCV